MQKLNDILKFIEEWDEFEENGVKVERIVYGKEMVQKAKKMKPVYEKRFKEIEQ